MSAAPSLASFHSLPSRDFDTTSLATKSQSNVLVQSIVVDAAFRNWFLATFSKWLQSNFRGPEHVAAAFPPIRYSTALNWWNGQNRISGDHLALIFMRFPDVVAFFLAEWQREAA